MHAKYYYIDHPQLALRHLSLKYIEKLGLEWAWGYKATSTWYWVLLILRPRSGLAWYNNIMDLRNMIGQIVSAPVQ